MMEILGQWLEKILLLVLLATFLDMLLPNTSLQRYVKLVMGLLILLTMITPILQLIKSDFSPEKMATRMWNLNPVSSRQGWQDIRAYGEKLLEENQEDAKTYVQEQLQSLIKARVEEDFGIAVKSVSVGLEMKEKDKQQAYPAISSVQLIVDKDKPGPAASESSKNSLEIQPIEPVTINVSGETSQKILMDSTSSQLTDGQRKLLDQIANHISATWSIERNRVIAKMEGNQEEG